MNARCLVVVASLAGCQIASPPANESPAPWPRGMSGLVTTDEASASATESLHEWLPIEDDSCNTAAYHAVELVADVAPSAGAETILASYANGIVVLDREGQLLASTTGYRCDGSIDEVESLAVGRVFGEPTIVVIARTGGRREYATFAGLFRVGDGKRLDPVFTATIEEHAGEDVRRGVIYMLPNGLVYRLPDGRYAFYVFDPVGRVYVVPGDPLYDPDHEPSLDEPRTNSPENT